MLAISIVILALTGFGSFAESAEESIRIQSLDSVTSIRSRFATTHVSSLIKNVNTTRTEEAVFFVQLPNDAFITNFTVEINGTIISGEVKEKKAAKEQYERAKSRGQAGGLVRQSPRDTNAFEVAVNVEPGNHVVFNLTYQQILKRVHGAFKHVVNVNPGKKVERLSVEVFMFEKGKIKDVKVPKPKEKLGEMSNEELKKLNSDPSASVQEMITDELSKVSIYWDPEAMGDSEVGSSGIQFVVLYDVERDAGLSSLEVVNGYFVHFFAPQDLPIGNKHVVFVLDVSGSMQGRKEVQMKEALERIVGDLRSTDIFNVITFSDNAAAWQSESVLATEANKKAALMLVKLISSNGGTNIHDALQMGLQKLKSHSSGTALTSMIIFLTDGQATSGITSSSKIKQMVKKENKEGIHNLHCVSFGSGADFGLLQRLASQNKGLARMVYEDSDSAMQLTGFYQEISSPLLTNVKINYLNETVDVDSLVDTAEYTYSLGSEIVTIGKVKSDLDFTGASSEAFIKGSVSGRGSQGPKSFGLTVPIRCYDLCPRPRPLCTPFTPMLPRKGGALPRCFNDIIYPPCRITCPMPTHPPRQILPPDTVGGFLERMWAYLTIKKLLKDAKETKGDDAKKLTEKALELSLKYKYVTKLTSMVVTMPESNVSLSDAPSSSPGRRPTGYRRRPLHSSMRFGGGGFGGGRRVMMAKARPGPPGLSGPGFPSSHLNYAGGDLDDPDSVGGPSSGQRQSETMSFRTATAENFDVGKVTSRQKATSRLVCAQMCQRRSACKAALFMPNMAGNNCFLSNTAPQGLTCANTVAIAESLPALIHCITTTPAASRNNNNQTQTTRQKRAIRRFA